MGFELVGREQSSLGRSMGGTFEKGVNIGDEGRVTASGASRESESEGVYES
jgi:hypothetical protein